MKKRAAKARTGGIRVEGSAVGSALITGRGNVVTIVYASDVLRTKQPVGENPYRGLEAFDETSSHLFFGRERLVTALLGRLEQLTSPNMGEVRLLAIMGPSGCGKSSVARAGLLPSLASAEAPWLRMPQVIILRPGFSPIEALADALARLFTGNSNPVEQRLRFASVLRDAAKSCLHDGLARIARDHLAAGVPLIVLVDQFEETYNLCRPIDPNNTVQVETTKQERGAFVATLLQAAAQPAGPVSVLVTLRSDFYGALVEHPKLSTIVAASHEIVPAMDRDDLQRAVAEPARIARHPLDPATVARILDQTVGEVTALPLMQFALERMWEKMRDGTAPDETLTAIGGVGGALARRADEILVKLPGESQKLVARAFLACIQLGDAAARHTRRRAWIDEVTPAGIQMEDSQNALDPFIKARLLATGAAENERIWLELPHETLIQHWQTLRGWIDIQREDLRFRSRLQVAAEAWNQSERPKGSLWRTPDLELLRRYAARDRNNLTALHEEFLDASERQVAWEKVIVRTAIAAIFVLAVVAGGLAILSWNSAIEAQRERILADQQRVLADDRTHEANEKKIEADEAKAKALEARNEALKTQSRFLGDLANRNRIAGDGVTAALLAIEAMPSNDEKEPRPFVPEGERALFAALQAPREHLVLRGHQDRVINVSFSSDGRHILTSSKDKTARIWDVVSGTAPFVLNEHNSSVLDGDFSPDGSRVITVSLDKTARIWDVVTGGQTAVLVGHEAAVTSAVFSADGSRVITAARDHTVRTWDAKTGVQLNVFRNIHQSEEFHFLFSPDRRRGLTVVNGGGEYIAELWDVTSGRQITVLKGHHNIIWSASFNADGTRVVTVSWDRTARIWDSTSGREIAILRGHDGALRDAAFNQDGTRVVTASDDGTARLWDVSDGTLIATFRGHEKGVARATFSPNGRRIVTIGRDNTARIWDAEIALNRSARAIGIERDETVGASFVLKGLVDDFLDYLRISPDGRFAVTTSEDNGVRLWDLQAGSEELRFTGGESAQNTPPHLWAALSPDTTRLVTVFTRRFDDVQASVRNARLWDVRTGAEIAEFEGHDAEFSIAKFSRDGSRIITVSSENTAELWDSRLGTRIATFKGHDGEFVDADFSQDGTQVVTASNDGTARLWDTRQVREIKSFIAGRGTSRDPLHSARMSPDGTRVVALGFNAVWLWETASGREIGILKRPGGRDAQFLSETGAVFSPDSRFLMTTYDAAFPELENENTMATRIWDATNGAMIGVLKGHAKSVKDAHFSSDGARVVTASSDRTAILWEPTTLRQICVLKGHNDEVLTAEFSPDNRQIVTSSKDKTVRLWHAETCREVGILAQQKRGLWSASFDKQQTHVLTASNDGTARIWPVLPAGQGLTEFAKKSVSRCLTPMQREAAFLDPAPPAWCIAFEKWPYNTPEWKQWLADKMAIGDRPMPPMK